MKITCDAHMTARWRDCESLSTGPNFYSLKEVKSLYELLEKRNEQGNSTII